VCQEFIEQPHSIYIYCAATGKGQSSLEKAKLVGKGKKWYVDVIIGK